LAVSLTLGLGLVGGCSLIKDPHAKNASDGPTALRSSEGGQGPMTTSTPDDALPTGFVQDASITFPEEDVLRAATSDDMVLTETPSRITARTLPELETAYAITSADGDFTDLRVDAVHDLGYSLEVATDGGDGTHVGEDRYTLQRFDLETGEVSDVAIATVPQDSLGSASEATARIKAVEGDLVVLDSWVPDSEGPHTALTLDLDAEELAWRAARATVLTVTPRLVIVNTGGTADVGRVEALAIGTGDRRWSALPGTLGASAIGTNDRYVAIARDDSVFPEPTITRLRLKDGQAGEPRTTDSWDWSCAPTSRPIYVCTLADGQRSASDRVVAWDVDRNEPAWRLPTPERFAPIVTLVSHDLVYGVLDSGQGVVLDAINGEDVAGETGAGPTAVNRYGGVVLYNGRAVFLPSGERKAETDSP
jgi:hypothetical protein